MDQIFKTISCPTTNTASPIQAETLMVFKEMVAIGGVGVKPLNSWDCGFEFH